MDADQNNHENHVQSHQNQEAPILPLPPLLRNLPGLEELRAAIEELQREEMAATFEAQAQALDGVPMASVTNGLPPPPAQHHAVEGGNPNATNNGHHSARATPTDDGHPPPPQYHAAEGGFIFDIGSDSDSDVDDVPIEP